MMYLDDENRSIRNNRYIDTIKAPFKTRLLSIKTCRFKPSNEEKV